MNKADYEDDPSDPSMVIEIRPPGKTEFIPQMITRTDIGEERLALCKRSQGDAVLLQFTAVYGEDGARLVPLKDWQLSPNAEQVRASLQNDNAPPTIFGGQSPFVSPEVRQATLVGVLCTMYIALSQGEEPISLAIAMDPGGGIQVCGILPDGRIDYAHPLLQCSADEADNAPLRFGASKMYQWILRRLPLIAARLAELDGGAEPPRAA